MTLEQAKNELIRRYRYLYENAYFILAPFMYEQSQEEYEEFVKNEIKEYGSSIIKNPLIYLKIDRFDNINSLFEEFLLSDKKLEECSLYKMVENNRNDKDYLDKVKKGLELVEKNNKNKSYKITIDMGKILNKVSDYIAMQSGDLRNKKRKLDVLDQYFRIFRYKNDGKIYTSGRDLNLRDCTSLVIQKIKRESFRDKKDIGITNNSFIATISNAQCYEDNMSIFTEKEKQKIYLDYHDELPHDLKIKCILEDKNDEYDTRLIRPDSTDPCCREFNVIEEEIFCNPILYNPIIYSDKYYQLCPHCGYIVRIPDELLTPGIKKRIEARNKQDRKLFRKMYLYSELFGLDMASTEEQKRLLKK